MPEHCMAMFAGMGWWSIVGSSWIGNCGEIMENETTKDKAVLCGGNYGGR
jgi:hypothetical protein